MAYGLEIELITAARTLCTRLSTALDLHTSCNSSMMTEASGTQLCQAQHCTDKQHKHPALHKQD
jgi:hypothetical protein